MSDPSDKDAYCKHGWPAGFCKSCAIEGLTVQRDALLNALEYLMPATGMYLHDRADGCEGHFCIERNCPHTRGCIEFWNDNGQHWAAFGTMYTKTEALCKVAELLVTQKELQ